LEKFGPGFALKSKRLDSLACLRLLSSLETLICVPLPLVLSGRQRHVSQPFFSSLFLLRLLFFLSSAADSLVLSYI